MGAWSIKYYLRQVKQSEKLAKEEAQPVVHKDYSLKEGEKIKIQLNVCFYNTGWLLLTSVSICWWGRKLGTAAFILIDMAWIG